MNGIIDTGGGTRGIYGCAVFDRCLDDNISFDYVIGVSAGSANAASYLAGQRGRNFVFYTEYSSRSEYMGIKPIIKTGSLVDLDYIYATLSNSDGENPLDFKAFKESPARFEVVATDVETGEPVYFSKDDIKSDNYECLMASCSFPIACKPYEMNGTLYYDGGLGDPIPFKRMLEAGCDKIVVIITKPLDSPQNQFKAELAGRTVRRKYPNAASGITDYFQKFNEQVEELQELEKEGRALIICPRSLGAVKTFSTDPAVLKALYKQGYEDAGKIAKFLSE